MKLYLTEDAVINGTDKTSLEKALVEIDTNTYYTNPVALRDVEFYARNEENGHFYPVVLQMTTFKNNITYDVWDEPQAEATVEGIGFGDLYREATNHPFTVRIGETMMLLGYEAYHDLLQSAAISGRGTRKHTDDLLRAVLKIISGNEYKFMYRTDESGNFKVLSVRSRQYAPIKQQNILSILDRLQEGRSDVTGWSMSNFKTEVQAEFPEIAKDYQEVFELRDPVMPGAILATSDTGDSSFHVRASIRIGTSEALPLPVRMDCKGKVRTRHYGMGMHNIERFASFTNEELFKMYRTIPERMAELAAMDGEVPLKKALELGFKAMKLRDNTNVFPEKLEEALIERICEEAEIEFTSVYDVVNILINSYFTEDKDGKPFLSESQAEHLKQNCLMALFAKYETIASPAAITA